MEPKLRLVRNSNQDGVRAGAVQEDQYRYPPHDEIWEVSCEPERERDEKPALTTHKRRAS
jgi:hypothetical protein